MTENPAPLQTSYEHFDFDKSPSPADHTCRIFSYIKGFINAGLVRLVLIDRIVNSSCDDRDGL